MRGKKITSWPFRGQAITEEAPFSLRPEMPDERLVESNVIDLYPDFEGNASSSAGPGSVIEGFGGAMTETSAYLLMMMEPEVRRKALRDLFSRDGLHFSFIRVSIDSCDYSLSEYQAVEDVLSDPDLLTFSIDRDRRYVIPALKEAMAIAEENGTSLQVLLSPWSPPWQWKTAPAVRKNDDAVYGGLPGGAAPDSEKPQRNNGGSLKAEFYGAWATYVVKYVKAYLEEGIPVSMMSLQNETVAATNWDSCVWTPEETKTYLKDNLYPEMEREGLVGKVGLYIWDHNKERMIEHVDRVLDEETLKMVEGIAFHWYSGDHFEAVDLCRRKYPDQKLMLSECCALHPPGRSFLSFLPGETFHSPEEMDLEDALAYAHDIIGNLNAGMNRWIDWNLVIDQNGGPRHVPGGFTSGLVAEYLEGTKEFGWDHLALPQKVKGYHHLLMYDYIRHFSGYIKPGARRIGWSRYADNLDVTAVKNPDGTLVCVLLNRSGKDSGCFLRLFGTSTKVDLPAGSITTLLLPGTSA